MRGGILNILLGFFGIFFRVRTDVVFIRYLHKYSWLIVAPAVLPGVSFLRFSLHMLLIYVSLHLETVAKNVGDDLAYMVK